MEIDISWLIQKLDVIKLNNRNSIDYLELKCYNIFEVYANDNNLYGTKEL